MSQALEKYENKVHDREVKLLGLHLCAELELCPGIILLSILHAEVQVKAHCPRSRTLM